MSQLSGIVSLFFIAAAFLTSCSGSHEHAVIPGLPTYQIEE